MQAEAEASQITSAGKRILCRERSVLWRKDQVLLLEEQAMFLGLLRKMESLESINKPSPCRCFSVCVFNSHRKNIQLNEVQQ